jgi:hypothetical protein
MADPKAPTHSAFTRKRLGKRHFTWLEIGKGRLDSDGIFHGILDRTPIGGFDGYVYFAPIGQEPPDPEPERPSTVSTDENS